MKAIEGKRRRKNEGRGEGKRGNGRKAKKKTNRYGKVRKVARKPKQGRRKDGCKK